MAGQASSCEATVPRAPSPTARPLTAWNTIILNIAISLCAIRTKLPRSTPSNSTETSQTWVNQIKHLLLKHFFMDLFGPACGQCGRHWQSLALSCVDRDVPVRPSSCRTHRSAPRAAAANSPWAGAGESGAASSAAPPAESAALPDLASEPLLLGWKDEISACVVDEPKGGTGQAGFLQPSPESRYSIQSRWVAGSSSHPQAKTGEVGL